MLRIRDQQKGREDEVRQDCRAERTELYGFRYVSEEREEEEENRGDNG